MGSDRSGSLGSLRQNNRDRVVATLREFGVASQAQLARQTGLSRTTVSSLVAELKRTGTIMDFQGTRGSTRGHGAGRPPRLLTLDRSAGAAVGIDFGKRHLAVAVCDLSHTVLAESRREIADDYPADSGMDAATELVGHTLAEAGIERERVLGVGLGLPGPIHRSTGTIGSSAILPGWVGVRVAGEMGRRLGLPVHIDNDANLGALAELKWGAGQGYAALVYLKLSTGIGAGLVVDGGLFHGVGGTAGEIGHTTIDEAGPICRCGSRGCLETLAAAPAIVELLRTSLGEDLTIEAIVERAAGGDPGCRRAIGDAGRHIGSAVANLCNLLNPERIVVGGSLGAAGDVLFEPLREAVQLRAIPTAAEDVEIVAGVLGERAEMLGAVALVLEDAERVFDAPALATAGET